MNATVMSDWASRRFRTAWSFCLLAEQELYSRLAIVWTHFMIEPGIYSIFSDEMQFRVIFQAFVIVALNSC